MWSVVTLVPAGTYEYRFLVDGTWKCSTRHDTVGEPPDVNNVRFFQGPAPAFTDQRKAVTDAHDIAERSKKCCCVVS